ncbi:MAG TPA: hypothetical protein VMZ03_07010 [Chitinophagaceae bacterium]|nr:hypothetical protein [Chitinophagaceae bacterium]
MKKIFTLSLLAITAAFIMIGCSRNSRGYDGGFDEGYWLSKERGEVVYSDTYCSYYIVETNYGYNIVQAYSGYKPYEGSMVYGNFSSRGTRDLYNRTTGYVFTGSVTDYWLTYNEAQDALDYYCPLGGKGETVTKRVFKASSFKTETK